MPVTARVELNFPYPIETPRQLFRRTPLLVASLRNGQQHFASRRAKFSERYRPAVKALLKRSEHTLLLAGSCGLELFNNLLIPVDALQQVTVFAYGPVARRRPDCDCLLVQGRRDWISRAYFRRVDAQVDCGHMDYLTNPAVLALAKEMVRRLTDQAGTSIAAP